MRQIVATMSSQSPFKRELGSPAEFQPLFLSPIASEALKA
jgi:hypothetical protein